MDLNDIYLLQEDTTQILWALGPNGSDGELPKHVQSGSRPLRLLQPLSKPDDASLMQWDIRLNDVSNTEHVRVHKKTYRLTFEGLLRVRFARED